jgi:hypothetical protein
MKTVLQPEVSSLPPGKAMWMLIGIGAVLASEIATVLSLAFLFFWGPAPFILTGMSSGLVIYLVAAPLACLLAGWLIWWLFILRPRRATVRRGILFGALSSIVAHPLMWGFASLPLGIVGAPLMWEFPPPLQWVNHFGMMIRLGEILQFSLGSLLYVGWITLVVGGAAGGLLISFQRTLTQRSRQL